MNEPGQPQDPDYQGHPYGSPPPEYQAPGASPGSPSPAYPAPGYPAGYGQAPARTDDTIWGILAHLSIFVFFLIAPLVIYLVFKDTSPFARHHGAEALNFHLTLTLASIVSIPLIFLFVGIPLFIALVIAGTVFAILATVAASRREAYRYPLTIHFVS